MSQRSYIVCALNFTPVRYDDFTIGLPKPGVLKEVINSDDTQYGGSGILNKAEIESADESFLDHPCSAKITLPPMAAVWFLSLIHISPRPGTMPRSRRRASRTKARA